MGVYLLSLVGITKDIFALQNKNEMLFLITLIFIIHSAAWRFLFSRIVGPEANYLFEGGVAGQRVLGAVLQPSSFGVLLILSIYFFVKDRVTLAVISLAIAASIHPTYLFSSAVLVFSYCLVIGLIDRDFGKSIRVATLGLLLVLPILVYVTKNFILFQGENANRAFTILANYRLSHHAMVVEWIDWTTIIQLALVIIATILLRGTKLFWIILVGTLSALFATVLVFFLDSEALALMFPWRISTILIPLAVSIIIGGSVRYLIQKKSEFVEKNGLLLIWICWGLIGLLVTTGLTRFSIEYQMKKQVPEKGIYLFGRMNHLPGEIYLIPPKLQDFRLETSAPVFVDSKSIPYREDEVIEWYRRLQFANSVYNSNSIDCRTLNRIRRFEDVTRVVIPASGEDPFCEFLIEEYRDEYYRVYRFSE
jgi:hypothetical protein